jgi:hypothetical protein
MATSASSHSHTNSLIEELEFLLNGGNAHAPFDQAVKDVSPHLVGKIPPGSAYSIWQLAEHIRIAQWDILEFSKSGEHESPPWPEGYWPKDPNPPNVQAFKKTVERIAADKKAFIALLHDAGENIFKPLPHGDGQTLLREALVIADHTSYHTGEIIVLRRIMGDWG